MQRLDKSCTLPVLLHWFGKERALDQGLWCTLLGARVVMPGFAVALWPDGPGQPHSPYLYIEDRTAHELDDVSWVKWPSKGHCIGFSFSVSFWSPQGEVT